MPNQLPGSDTDALRALAPYLWGVAWRILGQYASREDVEDCVAESMLRIWRGMDAHRGALKPFAASVTRNCAIDLRRRLSGHPFLPLEEDILSFSQDPADDAALAERRRLVNAALEAMDEPDRSLFILRYYWGESLEAIAAQMDMSQRAVEGRLYRGRQALKEILAPYLGHVEK